MRRLFCLLMALCVLTVCAKAVELPQELDGALPQELLDSAREGEGLLSRGASYLWSELCSALRDAIAASTRAAVSLMLLSLLCGLIEGTAEGTGALSAQYTGYAGVLGAAALAAGDLHALIGLGVSTVDELSVMAKLLLPTVAAAMAGGGYVGTASVWQVSALMMSDMFLSLLRGIFVPVLYGMIGTAAAGALLPQSRLSQLAGGIKKLLSWGLSALLIAYTGFLSVTNLLTGSADRVAVRAGKTIVSGAVPIVGGILSDAAETLLAGADTLRGTLGVLGVLGVLAVCLVPLVRLGVQYLLYRAAAFFCGLVGTDTLRGFLEQLSSAFSLVLAMTAGGAFLLLASLMIALLMVVTI